MDYGLKLVESGVDWLTSTLEYHKSESDDAINRAITLGESILWSERQKGNQFQRRAWRQYQGIGCGQAFVGKNASGLIYRLSGEAARVHWQDVNDVSTNVSRLDVAATFEMDGPWFDLTRVYLDEARAYKRERSPHLRVTRIDGGVDGCTLTVGSRSSDAYGRIYDKGAESKRAEYQGCWRFETEFKRSFAMQAATQLKDDPLEGHAPAAMALRWFGERRCAPGQITAAGTLPSRCLPPGDAHRSLLWLASDVQRSVSKLIAAGYLPDVLKALRLGRGVLESAGYVRQAPASGKEVTSL